MPSIEAHIATDRPNRYLNQLCRHAAAMNHTSGHRFRKHSDDQRADEESLTVHVERTDNTGVLTFTSGARCTVSAAGSWLTVKIVADDQQTLNRVRDVITRDLERFGRRDGMTITWA